MPETSQILDLRASVKKWEREFESKEGRKPSSSDARANKEVWEMYQAYRAQKKASTQSSSSRKSSSKLNEQVGPSTPRKEKRSHSIAEQEQGEDSDTQDDDDEASPKKPVTEVFPTPQFKGRVLGLFDVELDVLQTPRKNHEELGEGSPSLASSSPGPRTPQGPDLTETPQSKRTPEYFRYRVNLFPAAARPTLAPPQAGADIPESPLIKRKATRRKPVSEIIREASEIRTAAGRSSSILEEVLSESSDEEQADDRVAPLNMADDDDEADKENKQPNNSDGVVEKSHEIPELVDIPALHVSNEPGILDSVPVMNEPEKSRRKRPKRQTKRVIMRPIDRDGEVSTAKPTENYVRLKINNKNRRPFRRR